MRSIVDLARVRFHRWGRWMVLGLWVAASCAPQVQTGPSILWSKDAQSLDNPFPDPRLLGGGGLGSRPHFYESFLPAESMTTQSRGLFEGWARKLNSLPGFGAFNPFAIRLSEPPAPESLDRCAVFAVRTGDGALWTAIPAVCEYVAGDLLSSAQKFMLVRPTLPLPQGGDAILAIRKGPKTAAGKAFIRSRDYQLADTSERSADEAIAAAVSIDAASFAPAPSDLIFTMRFKVAVATADLQTVAAWASTATVMPAIPAKQLSPPSGVFVSTDTDFSTLDAWLLNTPWPAPARDKVGRVVIGTFPTRDLRDSNGVWKPEWIADPGAAPATPIDFVLSVPTGARPSGGWPVLILGHGLSGRATPASGSRSFALFQAQLCAEHGFACLAIDAVNHGNRGNWSDDLNIREPRVLRDANRQTALDTMLARRMSQHLDVDGDGAADLSPDVEYFGYSMGAAIGAALLGVDAAIKTGVLQSVGGGTGQDIAVDPAQLDLLLTSASGLPLDSPAEAAVYPLLGLVTQLVADPVDPINFAALLKQKNLLVSEGLGDKTQTNAGTDRFAAALGAPTLTQPQTAPGGISGRVIVDAAKFGVTDPAFDPHNVYQNVAPLRQTVMTFLRTRGTQFVAP